MSVEEIGSVKVDFSACRYLRFPQTKELYD